MTLQASGLTYARGKRKLFSNLDFDVKSGEALRVGGRNGSGKTSLLCVLCGLAEPQRGEVRWQGRSIRSQRDVFHHALAYIGHRNGVKDDLTALENVRTSAALAGRACSPEQAWAALDQMGLGERAHLPARVLSQGQRRRVVLARLAVGPVAPLLILDEPFNALDHESVEVLRHWLNRQLAAGASVVYTTHQPQLLTAARHHEIELGLDQKAEAI